MVATTDTPPARRRRKDGEARRAAILDAGLDLFSALGLHGASVDGIAERAGLSKTNLLYYFPSKEALYVAVLRRVLDVWLDPLQALDADSEPADALRAYIRAKLTLSRDAPQASRLFCLEVVQGAPLLRPELEGPLRALVETKAAIIRGWSDAGRIGAHDPHHLIFSIWAITQHYADFAAQVDAVTGRSLEDPDFFERVVASTQDLILAGLDLRSGPADSRVAAPDQAGATGFPLPGQADRARPLRRTKRLCATGRNSSVRV